MNKKRIQIVIVFSFLALVGSMVVQYYWIKQLFDQNQNLLEQNVTSALKYAIDKIDKEEKLLRVERFRFQPPRIDQEEIREYLNEASRIRKETRGKEMVFFDSQNDTNSNSVIVVNNSKRKHSKTNKEEFIYQFNDEDGFKTDIRIKIENDSVIQRFETKADSLIQVLEYKTIDMELEKLELETTVDQLVWEMDQWSKPFADSVPKQLIQSIIQQSFDAYNLNNQFEFAVYNELGNDSSLYQTEAFDNNLTKNTFYSELFPNELIPRSQTIALQIDNRLWVDKMLIPIIISLTFTLMLALGLILIIKNLLHHRNISQIQNDFINNMTHEFKTPIATISLASDSILNPGIIGNEEKVGYFTGMIKKENRRMNRLVEKILQMARLENKELKLDKQITDLHEILSNIAENTKVKLKDKGALDLSLLAQQTKVLADPVHLTNVVYNLIDNAIKYSKEPVQIEMHTKNVKNQLCIVVKDHGMGMSKKELQHIFDRFYRIEAGNVHNVKGHGLGLTYVKAIIEKHKGEILVKSEINKGSRFEIRLPLIK